MLNDHGSRECLSFDNQNNQARWLDPKIEADYIDNWILQSLTSSHMTSVSMMKVFVYGECIKAIVLQKNHFNRFSETWIRLFAQISIIVMEGNKWSSRARLVNGNSSQWATVIGHDAAFQDELSFVLLESSRNNRPRSSLNISPSPEQIIIPVSAVELLLSSSPWNTRIQSKMSKTSNNIVCIFYEWWNNILKFHRILCIYRHHLRLASECKERV